VTAAEAWRALQDPQTWAAIAGVDQINDVGYAADGSLAGYAFKVTVGIHTIRGSAKTVEAVAPRLMRLAISSAELTGWVQAAIGETFAGSPELTVSLSMRPRGLLATMFYPIIVQTAGSEFPGQVRRFVDGLNADRSNQRGIADTPGL